MSTSLIPHSADLPAKSGRIAKPRAIVDIASERMYIRFLAAAAIGLALGGIQGIIQRLPGISDWLYAAGYGGHLITNLAQTHVIMVGAGTLTVTAMMYYLLPRILNRPLYSSTLTRWSFWLTVTGVYGFYFVMLLEGYVLGGAVVHGIPYDSARLALGIWYDLPTGVAGGIMGVGYWLFVANIYLTLRGPKSWQGPESYIAKYIFVGTTGLFIGTIQGFYQVLPWSVNFIRETGQAGREIDPIAHAHINMVAGMAMSLMGMSFYILPRMIGKPIWNLKLARTSFWFTTIGVFGFWLTMIALGLVEGNMMLAIMRQGNNITVDQAYQMAVARVGIWHPLLQAGFGTIMGIGFWSYITIIYKTFASKPSKKAYPQAVVAGDIPSPPPDAQTRTQAWFYFAAVTAMLIGTIQGVIQILPFAYNWLLDAGQAGDMITPLAHAQMNIIASTGFGLMALAYFLVPRFTGKPWMSQQLVKVAFVFAVSGILMYYISLLTLGLIESIRVHQLIIGPHALNQIEAFNKARAEVGWAHPFWLTFSNCWIAIGYFAYTINIIGTLGPKHIGDALADSVIAIAGVLDRSLIVSRVRMYADITKLRRAAIQTFFMEMFGGYIGFLGAGWIRSGRLALGFSLMFTWFTGWLVFVEWTLTAQSQLYGPDFSFITPSLPLFFGLPIISAIISSTSYMRRGLKKRSAKTRKPVSVVETSALLIDDSSAVGSSD